MKKKLVFISIILFFASSCKYDKGPLPVIKEQLQCDTVVSYSTSILPIVMTKCAANSGCHGSGSINGDYTIYFDLGAKANSGKITNRVFEIKDMPQPGNPALSDTELSVIKCWIQQGATDN